MAYIDQEMKKIINSNVQPILKKYGLKGTLSIRHYSAIILTLRSGIVDFGAPNTQYLSHGYAHRHLSGIQQEIILKLDEALMSAGWYDRSEIQTDYFDTAYYYYIQLGERDKPYQLIKQAA